LLRVLKDLFDIEMIRAGPIGNGVSVDHLHRGCDHDPLLPRTGGSSWIRRRFRGSKSSAVMRSIHTTPPNTPFPERCAADHPEVCVHPDRDLAREKSPPRFSGSGDRWPQHRNWKQLRKLLFRCEAFNRCVGTGLRSRLPTMAAIFVCDTGSSNHAGRNSRWSPDLEAAVATLNRQCTSISRIHESQRIHALHGFYRR